MKNFRWNIAIRVVFILGLCMGLAWVIVNKTWFFTPLVLFILLAITTINLIYYTERTNKNLAQFLISIKQGGFTSVFTSKRGKSQAKLSRAFNDIIDEFRKISSEKESQHLYLQALNENIGVSIISYDDRGKIEFMNPAAKSLLKKPYLRNIDEFNQIDSTLHSTLNDMSSGQKRVIKTFINNEMQQLSVQVKDFVLNETSFRLVLMQNINAELEQKEVEAWQKLISVLTHEIMNSVTPIASLSTAVNQMVSNSKVLQTLPDEEGSDILTSLNTIEIRSKGLLHFVNAYKSISRIPDLNLTHVNLEALLKRIVDLLKPDMDKAGITLQFTVSGKPIINADHDLLEQVVINLVKNAIEAITGLENSQIHISAEQSYGSSVNITISDNGPGIPEEILDKIFIPFYTTKKTGTGVGLSFARQIMKLHNGNISVKSEAGNGTSFTLSF